MSERVRRYLAGEGIEVERDGLRVVRDVAQGPAGSPAEDIVTLGDVDGVPFAVAGAEQLRRALRPTAEPGRVRVGSEREGWKPRIAGIELDAANAYAALPDDAPPGVRSNLEAVLAGLRALLDGDR